MKRDGAALDSVENLRIFLDNVAQELPIIRPIKEFIHLNLLLPYQNMPFWDALKLVSLKFEAMPFAELSLYRDRIQSGEVPKELVLAKLKKYVPQTDAAELMERIMRADFEFTHHDLRVGSLHHLWNKKLGVNIIQLADGMLIKWLGMYMDQGIGLWEMPGCEEKSFYHAMKDLLSLSYVKPAPFSCRSLGELFPETAEEAIFVHLGFLCPKESSQLSYLHESIFTLRGWAGLIFQLEKNPALIPFTRKISLIDFIAVKLTLERAWILEHDQKALAPDFSEAETPDTNPLFRDNYFEIFRSCQEALEEVNYQKVLLDILKLNRSKRGPAKYQLVFCMDDRECALRRHLEELTPEAETFGTAGHYGIECLYQHSEDPFARKQCPAPVPPKYLLKDEIGPHGKLRKGKGLDHHLIQPSHSLWDDWHHSLSGGIRLTGELVLNLFFPLAFKNLKNVREVRPNSELRLIRSGDEVVDGLKVGYSIEEMADVVHGQLMLIGFVHHFAPLIVFVGHGSNSVNNPYFAAYGCGACSGRPGSANSRALAQMANKKEVRELLKSKHGICIPENTTFLAGFHDTCREVVDLYDTDKLDAEHTDQLKHLKKHLSVALFKAARERSRAFKLVTFRAISKEAHKEVMRRSYSLFETRPELGHQNVCFSIVGRRSLTQGLNLGRRAFLQSYDRNVDPTGDILAASLGAVIPVTSGINLDYFFSRVDNLRLGAGSKLPQNIVGNIGVGHGTESDLLFGLPFQMIDQHTPLRLLVLVEQSPELALYAIQQNALVKEIVYNGWIHYTCWDDATNSYYIFQDGKMEKASGILEGVC
jgi:uncharacterized protein YbcC (UPF0753/DUF2309 family)